MKTSCIKNARGRKTRELDNIMYFIMCFTLI